MNEHYTGVKALWLEGNGLSTIENLDNMKELRCLYAVASERRRPAPRTSAALRRYMQNNLVRKIEGLDNNLALDTLQAQCTRLGRARVQA